MVGATPLLSFADDNKNPQLYAGNVAFARADRGDIVRAREPARPSAQQGASAGRRSRPPPPFPASIPTSQRLQTSRTESSSSRSTRGRCAKPSGRSRPSLLAPGPPRRERRVPFLRPQATVGCVCRELPTPFPTTHAAPSVRDAHKGPQPVDPRAPSRHRRRPVRSRSLSSRFARPPHLHLAPLARPPHPTSQPSSAAAPSPSPPSSTAPPTSASSAAASSRPRSPPAPSGTTPSSLSTSSARRRRSPDTPSP